LNGRAGEAPKLWHDMVSSQYGDLPIMDDANRRLAGILAADVVGYSAMVGTDEPATLARVRTLRADIIEPLAASHGGRLFKTTGDGFFVAFASAVQALRCAVAFQERLRSERDGLRLRIGVHQGEVVAEGDDLLGDGVIIAARLEPLAEPGGICISARVREDAAGKLDLTFTDLGDQQLKNIARPIRVYAIDFAASRPLSVSASLLPRLSIVVLPFANYSGDREQQYMADALTDDVTTDLSRIADLGSCASASCARTSGAALAGAGGLSGRQTATSSAIRKPRFPAFRPLSSEIEREHQIKRLRSPYWHQRLTRRPRSSVPLPDSPRLSQQRRASHRGTASHPEARRRGLERVARPGNPSVRRVSSCWRIWPMCGRSASVSARAWPR
jgi:class 3 adenylate cyclase